MIQTGDYDNDGFADLIVANSGSNDISVYLNDGSGDFSMLRWDVGPGTQPYDIANLDFDDDGDLDLVVSSWSQGTVNLMINGGSGCFVGFSIIGTAGTANYTKTVWLEGTGGPGVFVSSKEHGNTVTLLTRKCE